MPTGDASYPNGSSPLRATCPNGNASASIVLPHIAPNTDATASPNGRSPLRATALNGSTSVSFILPHGVPNTDIATVPNGSSPLRTTGTNGNSAASVILPSAIPNTDAATDPNGNASASVMLPIVAHATDPSQSQIEFIATNVINISSEDHECTRNYDGSSGGIESNGMMLRVKCVAKDF